MVGKSIGVMLAVPVLALAVASIPSSQAAQHVGESATVCGPVAEVYHAWRSRGQPTFLDSDAAYPNSDFDVVVWCEDAARFGDLEAFEGKDACASGLVTAYRGRPEIVARNPRQLWLK